ncbi:MAG: FecR domain-containing protein [Elusimicrobia bacterium]|nr:FecR domain-containing protein [Elusimicrobiota bacterium]
MKYLLCAVLLSPSLRTSAASPAPAGLINIGVASAVNGSVSALAPGAAAGRVVETGKPVYSRDKVTTGAGAKLQVLLLDQTSFTIGPNSELVLNEFYYDPNTSTGKVAANVTKGAFRFITGKIARRDPASMQVTTPVGTIGIRGTMTAGAVSAGEATFVLLGPGPNNNADEKTGGITVKNDQGSTDVDQDGWGVTVKAGEAPSAPFKLDAGQLDGILSDLASAPKPDSKDGSADGGPADESSGQRTATGRDTAGDAFATLDADQGETGDFASQQFGAPTEATWEQIIAIPGGKAKYTGSGQLQSCPSQVCGGPSVGAISYTMNIDFGARSVTGGTIVLSGARNDTGTINTLNYGSLAGPAKSALSVTGTGSYAGTTLELLNAGGVVAGASIIDVHFNSSGDFGGAVTGTMQ